MSYSEVKNLPVRYRRWFIDRLVKESKDRKESHSNSKNTKNLSSNVNKLNEYEKILSDKFK